MSRCCFGFLGRDGRCSSDRSKKDLSKCLQEFMAEKEPFESVVTSRSALRSVLERARMEGVPEMPVFLCYVLSYRKDCMDLKNDDSVLYGRYVRIVDRYIRTDAVHGLQMEDGLQVLLLDGAVSLGGYRASFPTRTAKAGAFDDVYRCIEDALWTVLGSRLNTSTLFKISNNPRIHCTAAAICD